MNRYIYLLLICVFLPISGCDDYRIIHIVDQVDEVVIDQTLGLPKTIIGRNGSMMALIPNGIFEMGDHFAEGEQSEQPVHEVELDAFYMDMHEITVGQYRGFIEATGYQSLNWKKILDVSPTDNHPMVHVSWFDTMSYAKWVKKRLPTEAEWEYAARGGLAGKRYAYVGNIHPSKANYNRNIGQTTAVGTYPPNSYELYDIAGNVWEWCLDTYDPNFYSISPRKNPIAEANVFQLAEDFSDDNKPHILRGGSWGSFGHQVLRVPARHYYGSDNLKTDSNCGFRCVQSVQSDAQIQWNSQ